MFDILDLEDKISHNRNNRQCFVVAEISSVVFETGSNNISNELNIRSTTMNLIRQNSEEILNSHQEFIDEIINDCILIVHQENSKSN